MESQSYQGSSGLIGFPYLGKDCTDDEGLRWLLQCFYFNYIFIAGVKACCLFKDWLAHKMRCSMEMFWRHVFKNGITQNASTVYHLTLDVVRLSRWITMNLTFSWFKAESNGVLEQVICQGWLCQSTMLQVIFNMFVILSLRIKEKSKEESTTGLPIY